jgi:hypothetical protein
MSQTKLDILQETFLTVRAKLLEVAATLDRIDRADAGESKIEDDLRYLKLKQGIHLLLSDAQAIESSDATSRAELIQLLFSRTYEENWAEQFKLNLQR